MRKTRGDGVTIQLAIWRGGGVPLLCIHGLSANCHAWDSMAAALAPSHCVLAMDLRGRGLSESPPSGYSVWHHCEDIRCVLEDMKLDRIILVGHSLGAVIALTYAAQYPAWVERLILVDGGGKLSKAQTERVFAGIKPSLERLGRVYPSLEEYIKSMQSAPFLHPWSKEMEAYFRYDVEETLEGVQPRVQPACIAEEIQNLQKTDVTRLYPQIACPTLILRAARGMLAKNDILLPPNAVKRMIKQIPNARRLDIKGVNHYTILLHPNTSRDEAIRAFIEEEGIVNGRGRETE